MIEIDKLYFINLDKRLDRLKNIESVIENFNIDKSKVKRISAFDKPGNGSYGCALSHISAIEDAIENNYKNIIILEDDFITDDIDRLNDSLGWFFKEKIKYDILMLSVNIINHTTTNIEQIIRILDGQTTSGYCINSNFFNAILENFRDSANQLKDKEYMKSNFAIDQNWKSLQTDNLFLSFLPKLGKQMSGFSDIEDREVGYNC